MVDNRQNKIKETWYAQIGSDPSLIDTAILHARVTGSIGATEQIGFDGPFATVRREGYQSVDYYKVEHIW